MTKKILLTLTALVMVLAMMLAFTACTPQGDTTPATEASSASLSVESGADLISQVWAKFTEDQKFAVMGGDMNNLVNGDAGKFDIADTDGLGYTLHFPVASVELIDEAASLVHAMNANTFTAAAVHLKDAKDMDALCDAIKAEVMSTQWMCGFPDGLRIYAVGSDYIVYFIGNTDNITNFAGYITDTFGSDAQLKVEESLE